MNWEQLRQLGCKLPEVSIETWYRTPVILEIESAQEVATSV